MGMQKCPHEAKSSPDVYPAVTLQPYLKVGACLMGNSFAITLASKNWKPDVAAWELAVLRLPGAQIDDVFHLGNRLDPAWYKPMSEQGMLRWVRGGDAPPEITVFMQAPPATPDELPPRW